MANVRVILGKFGKLAERDGVPFGSRGTAFSKREPIAASPRAGKAYANAVFREISSDNGNL